MILVDVNVLVYAFCEDAPEHEQYRAYLEKVLHAPSAYGFSNHVLSGFLRIVTHPSIFNPPAPLKTALEFIEVIREQPQAVQIGPGPRHWKIFIDLCEQARAKGNLIPDAYLAALAIESGCEWITTDRDFARFSELNWRHPLD